MTKTNGELLADLYCRNNRQMPWWLSEEILALNSADEFETWHATVAEGCQKLWDWNLEAKPFQVENSDEDEAIICNSRTAYKFVEQFESELYCCEDEFTFETEDNIPF